MTKRQVSQTQGKEGKRPGFSEFYNILCCVLEGPLPNVGDQDGCVPGIGLRLEVGSGLSSLDT